MQDESTVRATLEFEVLRKEPKNRTNKCKRGKVKERSSVESVEDELMTL